MEKQEETDYEFAYQKNGIYTLSSKGKLILEGTFDECVAEYEKQCEGGKQ